MLEVNQRLKGTGRGLRVSWLVMILSGRPIPEDHRRVQDGKSVSVSYSLHVFTIPFCKYPWFFWRISICGEDVFWDEEDVATTVQQKNRQFVWPNDAVTLLVMGGTLVMNCWILNSKNQKTTSKTHQNSRKITSQSTLSYIFFVMVERYHVSRFIGTPMLCFSGGWEMGRNFLSAMNDQDVFEISTCHPVKHKQVNGIKAV